MASGSFRRGLQQKILTLLQDTLTTRIRTYDVKLIDMPVEDFPYLVVNVRQKEQDNPGEIGTLKELWQWTVHIYYLDISETYVDAEERRDKVVDDIETVLEQNFNLGTFSVTITPQGNTERVYDSNFSSVLFDSSGQEDYYTFVSELYLTVDTQRN